ncbi:MAG: NAD(P)-dependent oxidoreductase [Bacteroidota bacterium]
MKITFVGLGIMGSRMATNLLQSGQELTVYNRSAEARQKMVDLGANGKDDIHEAVAEADIVISMLSKPEVVEQLFLGDSGALSAMKRGSIWVDCSTNNPSFSRKAARAASKLELHYADAPVVGSSPQAKRLNLHSSSVPQKRYSKT